MASPASASIEVTVHLHPYLSRYSPRVGVAAPQALSVPAGTTVGELLTGVCGLPASLRLFVARNGLQARTEDTLQQGDRVRLFMQLSGG